MDWISLALPFAYLIVLIASMYTFSNLYRARQAAREKALQPWFPRHLQRDMYLSLLEQQSRPDTKLPDSLLKAALLRRATESVHRLISLRGGRGPLQALLQRGSVGEELWQRFLIAEKEIEAELQDIVKEATALAPQQEWGRYILQSASESAANEILRRRVRGGGGGEDGREGCVGEEEGECSGGVYEGVGGGRGRVGA